MNKTVCVLTILAAVASTGCETESPYFDSQLGRSRANMVQAQTLDPATAGNPAALAPTGADGQRLKTAIDQYHKDVPKPDQSVQRPIMFEVGQGGGQ